jgi:MOSC domain-containing protein YiiM
MRIISINCSLEQDVFWNGKAVKTGIFKTSVSGPVPIRFLNLEGDRQADLRAHGGVDKAVYSYDREDYSWWENELQRELAPGAFGENLTTEGLLDREVCVGDTIRAGSAVLQAVQPRMLRKPATPWNLSSGNRVECAFRPWPARCWDLRWIRP